MMIDTRGFARIAGIALSVSLSGCATVSTLTNADRQSAKVFSGTRLDAHSLSSDADPDARFNVTAPACALCDLPLSFAADLVLLPITVPVAWYELIFERRP